MPAIAFPFNFYARLSSHLDSAHALYLRTSNGMRTRALAHPLFSSGGRLVLTVGSSFFPGFIDHFNSPMVSVVTRCSPWRLHIQLADLRPGSTSREDGWIFNRAAILPWDNMAVLA